MSAPQSRMMGLGLLLLTMTLSSCSTTPPYSPAARVPQAQSSVSTSSPPASSQSASTQPPQPSPAAQPNVAPREPSTGSRAYLDYKNGFRDLHFGDPPKGGMVLTEDGGDSKFYARSSDDLSLGGAHLSSLVYNFYKNRLHAMRMTTKGLIDSRALLEVLSQAYGTPSRPNRFMEGYRWHGSKVTIMYDEDSITRAADVWFFSNPLAAEKEEDKKSKAKKGMGGL
jgi:hypothetical protein